MVQLHSNRNAGAVGESAQRGDQPRPFGVAAVFGATSRMAPRPAASAAPTTASAVVKS